MSVSSGITSKKVLNYTFVIMPEYSREVDANHADDAHRGNYDGGGGSGAQLGGSVVSER